MEYLIEETTILVQTREQFDAVVDCVKMIDKIGADTETNGLKVHQGHRLCGISVYFRLRDNYTLGAYFPFRHAPGDSLFNVSENLPIEWLAELGVALGRESLTTVWHNAKFDLPVLRADEIEIHGEMRCVLMLSMMVNENGSHKLGDLEVQHLNTSTKHDLVETNLKPYLKGKKDYSKVPSADMEKYAVNDSRLAYELDDILIAELTQQEQIGLVPTGMKFLRTLFEMEWRGIGIDQDLARQLSSETEARMRTLEDEMGFDPQKRVELARRLFASPPIGLGLQAPKETTKDTSSDFPTGLPKMDEAVLATYKHPLIDMVLEYRRCVKLNSTFYQGYLLALGRDGCIHPTYNTGRDDYGTVTWRLTCSGPNIQQQPRNPQSHVRKLCVPPWRMRLMEFDYNQIEYRLAGVYADEPAILDAYRAGSDMHQLTADKLGIPRVDPKGGVDGKKINFTILYGGGPQRIASTFGGTLAEGKEIFEDFWKGYPRLRELVKSAEKAARTRGWIRLWDGHRRHLIHEWEYRNAFNSLIQGGAALMVQRSMLLVDPTKPYRMVAQIHDALQFYVPWDFFEEYVAEIKGIMEWPSERFACEFPVEAKDIHVGADTHMCTGECFHDVANAFADIS